MITINDLAIHCMYNRPGHTLQLSSHQFPLGHSRYINISQLYSRFLFFPSQSTYTVNLTRTSMLLNDTQTHMYNVCTVYRQIFYYLRHQISPFSTLYTRGGFSISERWKPNVLYFIGNKWSNKVDNFLKSYWRG